MEDPQVQRDLGRHDAQIDQLQHDVSQIKKDVRSILETLAQAKGGWRTLLLVSGVSASVGALIAKLAAFYHLFIPPPK